MSNNIVEILEKNLNRKTLKKLSLNNQHTVNSASVKHLINSDKKCYDFDKIHPNNSTVDALEYKDDTYYLIEFKDQKTYIPPFENKKNDRIEISNLVFKLFQSINSVLGLYIKNNIPKINFHSKKLHFLIIFSSNKSTDLNDFKTLKTFLMEKYGNILEIDILNEKMFINEYVNTNKVGI